jgi:hypothetical protein
MMEAQLPVLKNLSRARHKRLRDTYGSSSANKREASRWSQDASLGGRKAKEAEPFHRVSLRTGEARKQPTMMFSLELNRPI